MWETDSAANFNFPLEKNSSRGLIWGLDFSYALFKSSLYLVFLINVLPLPCCPEPRSPQSTKFFCLKTSLFLSDFLLCFAVSLLALPFTLILVPSILLQQRPAWRSQSRRGSFPASSLVPFMVCVGRKELVIFCPIHDQGKCGKELLGAWYTLLSCNLIMSSHQIASSSSEEALACITRKWLEVCSHLLLFLMPLMPSLPF